MELLTVKDVAELKGCSTQFIRLQLKQGKIDARLIQAANGRPQYLVPVTALSTDLQRKYYRRSGVTPPAELKLLKAPEPAKTVKSLEEYTEQQRDQIGYWVTLLEKWQTFRLEFSGPKSKADAAFIKQEQLDISAATLYRRQAALKANDLDGLVELRGQWRKGQSDMPNGVWRVFLSYYLDQSCDPVQKCIRSARDYLTLKQPELLEGFPSDSSFYWRINQDIPPAVTVYNRKGFKALHDRYAP